MDSANEYLVFTSLLSFSFFMAISSIRQIREFIPAQTNEKNLQTELYEDKTYEDKSCQHDCSDVLKWSELTSFEREPSIKSNFTHITCQESIIKSLIPEDRFKKLFKF